MVAGDTTAIYSVASLSAGPAAKLVIADPTRTLSLATAIRVAVAIAIHDAYRAASVHATAVIFSTSRGDDWEEREHDA